MGDDLFADAGDFHLGFGPLVLGDGKVQSDVDDGQHEEGEEGGDQEERLVEHREPVSERFKVKNLGNCFTAGEKRVHKLDTLVLLKCHTIDIQISAHNKGFDEPLTSVLVR